MERMITKHLGERFPEGKICNYSRITWLAIAKNADMELTDFTKPVVEAARGSLSGASAGLVDVGSSVKKSVTKAGKPKTKRKRRFVRKE